MILVLVHAADDTDRLPLHRGGAARDRGGQGNTAHIPHMRHPLSPPVFL